VGGEGGGNAERPGRNCDCRQGETSVDWRLGVVEDYERGKRDEGEGKKCSTQGLDASAPWNGPKE